MGSQPVQSFFTISSWLAPETNALATVDGTRSPVQAQSALSPPHNHQASPACSSSSCCSGNYTGCTRSPTEYTHKTPIVPGSRYHNPMFAIQASPEPEAAIVDCAEPTPHTTTRRLCFEEKEEELKRLRAENQALLQQVASIQKDEVHKAGVGKLQLLNVGLLQGHSLKATKIGERDECHRKVLHILQGDMVVKFERLNLQDEIIELETLRRNLINSPDSINGANTPVSRSHLRLRLLSLSRQSDGLLPPKEISYTTYDPELATSFRTSSNLGSLCSARRKPRLSQASLPDTSHRGSADVLLQPPSSLSTPCASSDGGLTVPRQDAAYGSRSNSMPGSVGLSGISSQADTDSPQPSHATTPSSSSSSERPLSLGPKSTGSPIEHTLDIQPHNSLAASPQPPAALAAANVPACHPASLTAAERQPDGVSADAAVSLLSASPGLLSGWYDQQPLITLRSRHMGPDATPSPCAAPTATPRSVGDVKDLFDENNPLASLTGIEMWAHVTQVRLQKLLQEAQRAAVTHPLQRPATCSVSTQTLDEVTAAWVGTSDADDQEAARHVKPAAGRQLAWSEAVTIAIEPCLPDSAAQLVKPMLSVQVEWHEALTSGAHLQPAPMAQAALVPMEQQHQHPELPQQPGLAQSEHSQPTALSADAAVEPLHLALVMGEPSAASLTCSTSTPNSAHFRAASQDQDMAHAAAPQDGTDWLLPFVQGQALALADQARQTQDDLPSDVLYPPSDAASCRDSQLPLLAPVDGPTHSRDRGCSGQRTPVSRGQGPDSQLALTASLEDSPESAAAWGRFTQELLTLSPMQNSTRTQLWADPSCSPQAAALSSTAAMGSDAGSEGDSDVVHPQPACWACDVHTCDQNPAGQGLASSSLSPTSAAAPAKKAQGEAEQQVALTQGEDAAAAKSEHDPAPQLPAVAMAPVMDVWTELAMELMQASPAPPAPAVRQGHSSSKRPSWRPYPCRSTSFSSNSPSTHSPARHTPPASKPAPRVQTDVQSATPKASPCNSSTAALPRTVAVRDQIAALKRGPCA